MSVAASEQVLEAVRAALAGITGVSGLVVERERDSELTDLPAILVFEGELTPQDDFTGEQGWTLAIDLDLYVGGADPSAIAAAAASLRAKVHAALRADITLGIGCRDIRFSSEPAPVRGSVEGSAPWRGIGARIEVDFATPETTFFSIV